MQNRMGPSCAFFPISSHLVTRGISWDRVASVSCTIAPPGRFAICDLLFSPTPCWPYPPGPFRCSRTNSGVLLPPHPVHDIESSAHQQHIATEVQTLVDFRSDMVKIGVRNDAGRSGEQQENAGHHGPESQAE